MFGIETAKPVRLASAGQAKIKLLQLSNSLFLIPYFLFHYYGNEYQQSNF
jgi:hypothetical protein